MQPSVGVKIVTTVLSQCGQVLIVDEKSAGKKFVSCRRRCNANLNIDLLFWDYCDSSFIKVIFLSITT